MFGFFSGALFFLKRGKNNLINQFMMTSRVIVWEMHFTITG